MSRLLQALLTVFTFKAAPTSAAGRATVASAAVLSLMKGVIKMMVLNRLKTLTAVLVLAGVLAAAAGWLCIQARAAEPAGVWQVAPVPAREGMRPAVSTDEATFAVIAMDAKRKALALVGAGVHVPAQGGRAASRQATQHGMLLCRQGMAASSLRGPGG